MGVKNRDAWVKFVATGLIGGGLALATLATTGCGALSIEQIGALASGADAQPGALGVTAKAELSSKLAANHNVTFLTGVVR